MKASEAFVIAWSQTEIDGIAGLPLQALAAGCGWSWTGEAVRLDGSNDILVLDDAAGQADLRKRAARAAHRLLRRASVDLPWGFSLDPDDARIERDFTITDGTRLFRVALIELPQTARPLLMIRGTLPPRDRELWVVKGPETQRSRVQPHTDKVICFVRGTRLRTATGYVAVEDLRPGDALLTRDAGLQDIQWIGRRHLSGARLAAEPHLRPVRLRSGALGAGDPRGDLLVSPRHRLLLRGRAARDLFSTDEVLVEARDLLNDKSVGVDHSLKSIDYVHVLLPQHHVVWANGVATESFHPAETSLDALNVSETTELETLFPGVTRRPAIYGDPARRMLSPAEAAILLGEAHAAG